MAQGGTPVVQQRRLRTELRRAREEAGRTQKDVARDLGWSPSKVIRIETGAATVSTSDTMALLHYYNITEPERVEELLSVTRAKESSWWEEYRDIYGQQFLNFLAYEDSATKIRQFQGVKFPGLLQTEDYARVLLGNYMNDQHAIDRGTKVRMRRQHLLERANSPEMSFILDEAVIHRWVGGYDVTRKQLQRLKVLSEKPNISIRIVPYTAGVHPGMNGSFAIYEFSSADEDYVVNAEEPNSDVLIRDNPESTSNYVEAFSELQEIALSENDSIQLLDSVIAEMGAPTKD